MWGCSSLPLLTLGPAPRGYLVSPCPAVTLSARAGHSTALCSSQYHPVSPGHSALPGLASSAPALQGQPWEEPAAGKDPRGMCSRCRHQPHGPVRGTGGRSGWPRPPGAQAQPAGAAGRGVTRSAACLLLWGAAGKTQVGSEEPPSPPSPRSSRPFIHPLSQALGQIPPSRKSRVSAGLCSANWRGTGDAASPRSPAAAPTDLPAPPGPPSHPRTGTGGAARGTARRRAPLSRLCRHRAPGASLPNGKPALGWGHPAGTPRTRSESRGCGAEKPAPRHTHPARPRAARAGPAAAAGQTRTRPRSASLRIRLRSAPPAPRHPRPPPSSSPPPASRHGGAGSAVPGTAQRVQPRRSRDGAGPSRAPRRRQAGPARLLRAVPLVPAAQRGKIQPSAGGARPRCAEPCRAAPCRPPRPRPPRAVPKPPGPARLAETPRPGPAPPTHRPGTGPAQSNAPERSLGGCSTVPGPLRGRGGGGCGGVGWCLLRGVSPGRSTGQRSPPCPPAERPPAVLPSPLHGRGCPILAPGPGTAGCGGRKKGFAPRTAPCQLVAGVCSGMAGQPPPASAVPPVLGVLQPPEPQGSPRSGGSHPTGKLRLQVWGLPYHEQRLPAWSSFPEHGVGKAQGWGRWVWGELLH